MFKVNKGHSVTLGGQVFKSGKRLPEGRDYSTLILLGVVSEIKEKKPDFGKFGYEPSIVTITREKVKNEKAMQAKKKAARAKAKLPKKKKDTSNKPATPKVKGG